MPTWQWQFPQSTEIVSIFVEWEIYDIVHILTLCIIYEHCDFFLMKSIQCVGLLQSHTLKTIFHYFWSQDSQFLPEKVNHTPLYLKFLVKEKGLKGAQFYAIDPDIKL